MILFLDTTDLNKVIFALIDVAGKKRPIKQSIKVPYHENDKTLEHLDKFLRAHGSINDAPTNLSSIYICSGPGSFTGIRVGASIAQALSYSWKIPMYTIQKEKIPRDLKELPKAKASKKLAINYNKPPV